MGSFNVACSISNLSISYGTKCCLLPLMKNSYNKLKNEKIGSNLVSNDGPAIFFYPFCFPIFGEYDDYGRVGNIERTKTVECIEKYFQISIEDFVRIITCNRDSGDTYSGLYEVYGDNFLNDYQNFTSSFLIYPKECHEKIKILNSLSGMFIHADIYDFLSSCERTEWKKETWEENYEVNIFTLKTFGFQYIETVNKIERYNQIYKHPEVDDFVIGTDGTWSNIYTSKYKGVESGIYRPNDFIKKWKKITNHDITYSDDLLGVSSNVIRFDAYRQSLIELESSDFSDEVKDLLCDRKCDFGFLSRYDRNKYFDFLYGDSIKDNSIKDEFVKFANFYNSLYALNKFLFPAANGYQCGANWIYKDFCEEIIKIVKEEEKERKSYEN